MLRIAKAPAVILFTTAATLISLAQYSHPKRALDDGMSSQLVRTGLYVISGHGGNSVVRLSANGVILVDGKKTGSYEGLVAHIHQIVDQPVRALILTSCDSSRIGTNQDFVADGTRIIVQEHAKAASTTCNLPAEKASSATLTYASDYKIHLGGVEAELMHFGSAYSASDTVVYFPNLKIVAVGGLMNQPPVPDFSAGGSLLQWAAVLDQLLKLDFDIAVPSSGSPITKAEVQAYKLKIDTLTARSKELVAHGVPKEQFMTRLKIDDLGWQLSYSPDQIDHLYAEMSSAAQPTHEAHLQKGSSLPN